ncbi:hypothetical protein RYX36_011788 [Vicia faba]
MLERTLSSLRGNSHGEGDEDILNDDESKMKKQQYILFRFTNRFSTYLSRTATHCVPCLALAFILLLIFSSFFTSRNFVCISTSSFFKPAARAAFFSLDGLDSDFGALCVPCFILLVVLDTYNLILGKGRSKHGKTVEWTSKDLLKGLEEFVPIYETRPIKNNMYGMGLDHSFELWFIARWLKPDLMIESGAFKGHLTWVFRQAMPDSHIISVTPRHPEKYLKKGPAYVDGNCTYFAGKDFVDFGSIDWPTVMSKQGITDLSRVLIFFDDHQNELKR